MVWVGFKFGVGAVIAVILAMLILDAGARYGECRKVAGADQCWAALAASYQGR